MLAVILMVILNFGGTIKNPIVTFLVPYGLLSFSCIHNIAKLS